METSASLLERLATAPSDADWRRLHDFYAPLLARWIVRAGVPVADGDDLIQETMMAVVRDVRGFEHRGTGAFRAWLWRVLANRLRNYFRERSAQRLASPEVLADLEDPNGALSKEWEREHDAHLAKRVLRLVEPDFAAPTWAAFRRQVIDGQRAAVVAGDLGLSVNSVLLAKSRVLQRLRREMCGLV